MTALCLLFAVPLMALIHVDKNKLYSLFFFFDLYTWRLCTWRWWRWHRVGSTSAEWSEAATAVPWALERETCLLRTCCSLWLNSLRQWRNPSSHETNLERSYLFFSFFLLLGCVLRSQPAFLWCTLSIVHNGRLRWRWRGWWGKTGWYFCLCSIVATTRPPQRGAPCTSAGVLSWASLC